ncbi:MAG: hypothetical protein ACRDHP_03245, partial [Ktedonobacterales bacterium]
MFKRLREGLFKRTEDEQQVPDEAELADDTDTETAGGEPASAAPLLISPTTPVAVPVPRSPQPAQVAG